MKRRTSLFLLSLIVLSAFIDLVHAAGGPSTSDFLGSPLLVLVVLLIIDVIAVIYHRARK